MSLNYQHVDTADVVLREQDVVVAVHSGRVDLLIVSSEQNLVVVTIYYETVCHALLDVVRATMVVHYQVPSLVHLRLLLRSVLLLREILLHVVEHLLHVLHALKSLHVEWKSLTALHLN